VDPRNTAEAQCKDKAGPVAGTVEDRADSFLAGPYRKVDVQTIKILIDGHLVPTQNELVKD
jgi:hypothetical protein